MNRRRHGFPQHAVAAQAAHVGDAASASTMPGRPQERSSRDELRQPSGFECGMRAMRTCSLPRADAISHAILQVHQPRRRNYHHGCYLSTTKTTSHPKIIQGKKVAIIGYGLVGHAHALNLMGFRVDVRVGLREGSKSCQGRRGRLKATTMDQAAEEGDIVTILVPDEPQPEVYEQTHRFPPKAGNTPGLRPRASTSTTATSRLLRRQRRHVRPEGPGPYRPSSVHRGVPARLIWPACTRTPPVTHGIMPLLLGRRRVPVPKQGHVRPGDRGRPLWRAGRPVRRSGELVKAGLSIPDRGRLLRPSRAYRVPLRDEDLSSTSCTSPASTS